MDLNQLFKKEERNKAFYLSVAGINPAFTGHLLEEPDSFYTVLD